MNDHDETIATLEGVTRSYGRVVALRDTTLDVRPGELLAILGPNGAGKTTAIRLWLGLQRPDAGRVRVFGRDPCDAASRRRTGAMLQVARVPETLRVREHIDLFRSYYPKPLARREALEAAGLENLESRLFGSLSGGERQRVLFALALCGDPDLLFLDEPTVGLDVATRRLFWDRIRERVRAGRSVVLTTHYLEEVDALADRVVVLDRGAVIAQGTAAEIKSRTAQRRVRCITHLASHEVAAMAHVSSVTSSGERTEIRTARAEAVVRDLLARDTSLRELEVSSGSLEDAFLSLVRDEGSALVEEATA